MDNNKLYSLDKFQLAVEEIECWQFIDDVISKEGASKDLCPWEFTLNTGSSQSKDRRPSGSDWEASFSRGEYIGPNYPNNGWIKNTIFMADEDRLECLKLLINKFKAEIINSGKTSYIEGVGNNFKEQLQDIINKIKDNNWIY